jgi:uncharacterized membrane protein YgcG
VSRLFFGWVLLPALVASWSLGAGARELEWRALAVDARLDEQGRLHVSERHEMEFTGSWNGGERSFYVGKGQFLQFESIARLDEFGSWVPLSMGSLQQPDHYRWSSNDVLRWRIQEEPSGAFHRRAFIHRIDYVLLGVLRSDGNREYRLDHDFAFPQRPGAIVQFRLRLVLDESWRGAPTSTIELERGPLVPGQGVRVTLPLHYAGSAAPEPLSLFGQAWAWLTQDARLALSVLLLATLAALLRRLFWKTRRLGQSAPLPRDEDIDVGWIREHVLSLKPEVVGAVYDRDIGSAEVAAVLARLEREGKLSSTLEPMAGDAAGRQLALELKVPRDGLVSYERALIDELFLWGNHTSTEKIRSHYSEFNPAQALQGPLSREVSALLDARRGPQGVALVVAAPLALAAGVALHSSVVQMVLSHGSWLDETAAEVFGALGIGVAFLLGVTQATIFRKELFQKELFQKDLDSEVNARALKGCFTTGAAMVVGLALASPRLDGSMLARHFAGAFGLFALMLWAAWPTAHAKGVALRRRLAAARRYFEAQLRTRRPQLDDAWYPHLIALGLGPEIDGWFRAFAEEPRPEERGGSSSSDEANPSLEASNASDTEKTDEEEPPRWTGGGGRFGGGGASGSWGDAASELASSIGASDSRSSSSRSEDDSGSSSASDSHPHSGGGGGGGW